MHRIRTDNSAVGRFADSFASMVTKPPQYGDSKACVQGTSKITPMSRMAERRILTTQNLWTKLMLVAVPVAIMSVFRAIDLTCDRCIAESTGIHPRTVGGALYGVPIGWLSHATMLTKKSNF